MAESNRVEITGRVAALGVLRRTPTGVAVLELGLHHESEVTEAGLPRKVSAEIPAVALDAQARLLAGTALNRTLRAQGFLAAKSRRSKKLILHITQIEFIEGE